MAPAICPNDASFGPSSDCRTLDFTLLFQSIILSIVPDALFIIFVFPQLHFLSHKPSILLPTRFPTFLWLKVASGIALAGINLGAVLIYVGEISITDLTTTLPNSDAPGLAATILTFVATIPLVLLLGLSHTRNPSPNTLSLTYTLSKSIFTSAHLRSSILSSSSGTKAITGILAAQIAVYTCISVLETFEKRRLLTDEYKTPSKEQTSSILTRTLFTWLFPTLLKGRTSTLTLSDLSAIPPEITALPTRTLLSATLSSSPSTSTSKSANKDKENQKPISLLYASLRAFTIPWLTPLIPRLLLVLLTFAQPLLVNDLIAFVSSRSESSVSTSDGATATTTTNRNSEGWALVGGFICVYGLMNLVTALYWEKVFANIVQYRAALVGCIYAKSVRLSTGAAKSVGVGAASTLMSVDVERAAQCFEYVHELWAAVLSLVLAVVILYTQAGWPAFLPIIVILVVLFTCSFVGRHVGARQKMWLAATDKRIKLLSSVINRFLPTKWSAYEDIMAAKVEKLRMAEVEQAKHFYALLNVTGTLANNAQFLCLLSVIGVYAAVPTRGVLDVSRLFTIATTINLLSTPLSNLGQYTPYVLAGNASLKRIESFLQLDEKQSSPRPEGRSRSRHQHQRKKDGNDEEDGEVEEDDHVESPVQSGKKADVEWEITVTKRVVGQRGGSLRVRNASFAWTPEGEPFLRNIELTLAPACLHICIGTVASGKTMLLTSLLGEASLKSGTYTQPSSRIAYAAQDTFIAPGTIRANILFGRPFDPTWYDRVLAACALRPDLARMPFGDETLVGDKGGNLSGGQKQRLGLARAVYAAASITFLDDVFSAVDGSTEEHVFNALFGFDGLLQGKTVLLVTHNLRHLATADHIFVLEAGRIAHSGTLDEIQTAGYDYTASHGNTERNVRVVEMAESSETQEGKDTENEETTSSISRRGLGPYLFFGRMSGWWHMLISLLCIISWGAARYGSQGLLERWSTSNGSHWQAYVGGYAAFFILNVVVTSYTIFYATRVVVSRAALRIHSAELKSLFLAPPSYFMSTPAGRIINRLSQDIFVVDFSLPLSALNFFIEGSWLVGTLILTFIPAPWLIISLLVLIPMYYVLVNFYLHTSTQLQKLEAASKSPLYTLFDTTLSGLETIRAFKAQGYFQEQNDRSLNLSQGPFHYRYGGMRFLRTGLTAMTFILAVGLSALAVALPASTSTAFLGLALSNLTNLSSILSTVLTSYADMENSVVSVERIHEVVAIPPEEGIIGHDNEKCAPSSLLSAEETKSWPSRGSIVFEDVSFRYKEDQPPALSGVSFQIQPGQRVGICGRTGSGKSTITLSLMRAVSRSLTSGRILIDDVDINTIPPGTLRKSLTLVSQDPFLWYASVRDNLDPEGVCSESEVWTALGMVGMKEAVGNLSDKLDTVLEDGGSLSRGQRQLMCLARALLRRRQIVILDEASSSMDTASDEKIRQVVKDQLRERTVLAVAHRIATIVDFDLILVLENGSLIEVGPPADLLANQDSRFYSLAASQGLVTMGAIDC